MFRCVNYKFRDVPYKFRDVHHSGNPQPNLWWRASQRRARTQVK